MLKHENLALFPKERPTRWQVRSYGREFYDYSAPLVTYSCVGLLAGLLDRWLLQKFAGSVEQGFYGLSYQIGALCFLFTSAITPLLIREFSKAFGNHDLKQMRALFQQYIPMLYSVAAFFGALVAVRAGKVSVVLGGGSFQGATVPIALMALYPLHQTYGQLSGSVFLASGQTRLYRNIGISMMLLGLPVTFWLIGPRSWFGLDLGGAGLAIKMVILQFIAVNFQLWFNTRLLHLSFWKFFWHQIYCPALLIGTAWLVAAGVDTLVSGTLLSLLMSGIVYTSVCVGVLLLWPSIFGISREQLIGQFMELKRKVRSDTG